MQVFGLEINLISDKFIDTVDGRHVHGLLFKYISSIDEDLSQKLHDANEKPFSLWWEIRANSLYIEMPVFSDELTKVLLVPRLPQKAFLGGDEIYIKVVPKAIVTDNDIWNKAEQINTAQKLRISFRSPTSFRRSGVQLLFPLPDLLFRSAYTKLMMYGSEYTKANLVHPDDFSNFIQTSRYKLETNEENYGKYKIIGCTGYAVYDLRALNITYMRRSMAFLALMCNYTGIGYKTTMGMGHVECLFTK